MNHAGHPSAIHVVRRRPAAPPVYLLDVTISRGERTVARGAPWDGPLNASPEDTNDGPSPVEALLAGIAGCFVRNLRWVADGAHVAFDRIELRLAAERDDDPPMIREVLLEVRLDTDATAPRVAGVVERALRSGTIVRTIRGPSTFGSSCQSTTSRGRSISPSSGWAIGAQLGHATPHERVQQHPAESAPADNDPAYATGSSSGTARAVRVVRPSASSP